MSKLNPSWISEWNPEDETFWNTTGKVVARRNLIWSIVAEHIGFSVWLIWSIVATKLPAAAPWHLMTYNFRMKPGQGVAPKPMMAVTEDA